MKKDENRPKASPGLDVIGDLHGHADALRRLLTRLGYTERDGIYRHPTRKALFLGDFIDRGPAIRETLRLVRRMVDGGAALAVMGNHEFNALCYHTHGLDGKPLRAHSEKNRITHEATLAEFAPHPKEWADYLAWFLTLPLYLEVKGLRAVHAAWDDRHIATLYGRDRLDSPTLLRAGIRGTPEYDAVDCLLKGREIELPNGHRFEDKHGLSRSKIRVKWWLPGSAGTYRDLVFPESDSIPDLPVAASELATLPGYPTTAAPVFVGHYWLPAHYWKGPLATNVACLDYSVAKGGPLMAYRWNGESVLEAAGFMGSD